MSTTPLKGHTSPETAYVVEDYPYGFRLRTSIRYWLETNGHGTRFVSQTVNPKTGAWNKPKASTYVQLGVMVRDSRDGHIGWATWTYYGGESELHAFEERCYEGLTDADKRFIGDCYRGYERISMRKAAQGVAA